MRKASKFHLIFSSKWDIVHNFSSFREAELAGFADVSLSVDYAQLQTRHLNFGSKWEKHTKTAGFVKQKRHFSLKELQRTIKLSRKAASICFLGKLKLLTKFGLNGASFDVSAEALEAFGQMFVAALNLIDVADYAFAMRTHCGNYHCHACAHIRRHKL